MVDSKGDVNPLFFGSFQSEFELSSINCRQCFAWDFGIFTIESHRTQPIHRSGKGCCSSSSALHNDSILVQNTQFIKA